nr:tRNA (adenosine(37)-N6)-dimethylallyltransferase MiaA [Pseudonocardiales bacterium]
RYGSVLLGLDSAPAELDERIAVRVRRMFDDGLVEEVRELAGRGLRDGRTASRALGYQQVLRALDGGGDFETAAMDTIQATRRFVRRQRSWFRRDARIRWLAAGETDLVTSALGTVAGGS